MASSSTAAATPVEEHTHLLARLSLNASHSDTTTTTTIIIVENRELRCDTQILLKNAKYFEALFAFQKEKESHEMDKVYLNGCIDYESTAVILSGLQSGHMEVHEDNCQAVLLASTYLQCWAAERASADFILSKLALSNAYSIFLLGINCGSAYLAEASQHYIVQRMQIFDVVICSLMDQVLHLDHQELSTLLAKIADNYVSYITLCGWVLFDPEQRSPLLPSLLEVIIVELLPPDAVLVDGLEDDPALQEVAQRVSLYDSLSLQKKQAHWQQSSILGREPHWPKGAIVCSTGNNYPIIAVRTLALDRWHKLTVKPAKLKVKSSGSQVVAVGSSLYFIGGVGNVQMWCFSLPQDSWTLLEVEQDERIRPMVVAVDGCIYVFGGYTDRFKEVSYLDSAVKFNVDTLTWTPLRRMELARSGGQACHVNGQIYLFGGLCGRKRTIMSCEVYDVASDTHRPLTVLPSMMIDFGLVFVQPHTIFVIGGMDPLTFETKNTVYAFNVNTRQWSSDWPSLTVARKSCACFYDGCYVYVAGGFTAELQQLSSTERFSPRLGHWQTVDRLPKGLSASVSAVLLDLPVGLMDRHQ